MAEHEHSEHSSHEVADDGVDLPLPGYVAMFAVGYALAFYAGKGLEKLVGG